MRWLLGALLLSVLPAPLLAQRGRVIHVEGSAGLYLPDIGGFGDQKSGWTAGLRVALERRNSLELFAQYSWAQAAETDRTGVAPDFVIAGLRQQLMIAGVDLGVGGPLRIELALGGVGQLSRVERVEGNPDPTFYPDGSGGRESDWSWSAAAVPAVSYRILDRVVLRARDLMVLDDVLARHNIAFTIGIRAF